MKYPKIELPRGAEVIIETLEEQGDDAYIVGGCVRDSILGRLPGDWDITTSATPSQVKALFERTYDTGIQHGTVTVHMGEEAYEVTTYRVEGEYNDFRRPSSVKFTGNLIEDLKRRDYTMNAIAYSPKKGFADPFMGAQDIHEKIIRCVGDPQERFSEDALRMLRAVRFSAQLGFSLEDKTFDAIVKCGSLITKISSERIREELTKLLLSEHVERLVLLQESRLAAFILPELEKCFSTEQGNPYHIYNVGLHTVKTLENIDPDVVLRWTMLFHDMGKPLTKTTDDKGIDHFYGHELKSRDIAEKIVKRLRFDNKTADKISRLVRWHDRPIEATPKAVRRAIRSVGEDIFPYLLKVKRADILSQNPAHAEERIKKLGLVEEIYREIKESNQCISIKNLAVTGEDLKEVGFKEGKEIGILLEKLLDLAIEDPGLNSRHRLLEEAVHLDMRM